MDPFKQLGLKEGSHEILCQTTRLIEMTSLRSVEMHGMCHLCCYRGSYRRPFGPADPA